MASKRPVSKGPNFNARLYTGYWSKGVAEYDG